MNAIRHGSGDGFTRRSRAVLDDTVPVLEGSVVECPRHGSTTVAEATGA
jgi:hypothetical protein